MQATEGRDALRAELYSLGLNIENQRLMIKAYCIVDSLSYEGQIKANNFVDLYEVKYALEKGEFKVT